MATDTDPGLRHYKVLGVLGEGGFGRVYHARLEGPEGFRKDVAIKLLRDENPHEVVLQRFRDEARILGLLRDRALVSVEPPVKLAGRWAVIMDFVDGESCEALLGRGQLPASVALEVIGEVARTLDQVWNFAGPDGSPLRIIHRDLKPANIQITPSGDVKLLDFGIARAQFKRREAKTTRHIGGTPGYIAPERLLGDEVPAGDMYSLGIVLHELLTGTPPRGQSTLHADDIVAGTSVIEPEGADVEGAPADVIQDIFLLAARMRSQDPTDRPTAAEVEERCLDLRARCTGPRLRSWAPRAVQSADELKPDELVGRLLTQSITGIPRMPSSLPKVSAATTLPPPSRGAITAFALVTGAGAGIIAVLTGLVVLFGGLWMFGNAEPEVASAADLAPPGEEAAPSVAPDAPPSPAAPLEPEEPDEPEEPLPEEPEEAQPTDTPEPIAAAPRPRRPPRRVEPRPRPEPAPAPVPEPAAKTRTITFQSVPMGAQVFIDGTPVGVTPLIGHPVPEGTRRVRMTLDGGAHIERLVDVGRHKPIRYVWRSSDGHWTPGY